MNSIGIIGFGRFGKVLANILQKGFNIKAYDPKPTKTHWGIPRCGIHGSGIYIKGKGNFCCCADSPL